MRQPLTLAAMLCITPLVAQAEHYLPAPCDNGYLPESSYCPNPYTEMTPPPTGDNMFLQAWVCQETGLALGLVNDGSGGCGGAQKDDMFPDWTVAEAAAVSVGAMSEAEYRDAVLALFKDFVLMVDDGVFLSYERVQQLPPSGHPFPNKIRGDHPPGGWFGQPPGTNWLARLKALTNSDHPFVCFDIPSIPSHLGFGYSEICPRQALWTLQTSAGDPNPAAYLDGLVAQFWLATICHESPRACEPYLSAP